MPCNSDYLDASPSERWLSAVYQLLDELDGKPFDPAEFGNGYDTRVYNKIHSQEEKHALVSLLCARLRQVDVTKYSLEMQMWWRNHQRADQKRADQSSQ